ncbi:MAG TPA: hypothetical protein VFW15_01850 [Thermoanaerobaculia bacterium]|nr:hypothetical protein [Thermoanaerobaculia bacterium]
MNISRKISRIGLAASLLIGLSFANLRGASGTSLASIGGLSGLAGISGKLLAVFALPGDGALRDLAGAATGGVRLIVMKPFSVKVNGRIGNYRMGTWPYEGRTPRSSNYAPPKGFIEVTPENFGTHVSEHFTVGQFLTKDQSNVWPKYLVLDRRLLDKLELTIAELDREGYDVKNFSIMSGFRTPQYNERGVGAGGRSAVSRHQYGDASDVYPDDDKDGRMDDLNRDGRVDLKDARILASAAEVVEKKNPQLVGGIGIYPATSAHGPFVHIDARGSRARWNG